MTNQCLKLLVLAYYYRQQICKKGLTFQKVSRNIKLFFWENLASFPLNVKLFFFIVYSSKFSSKNHLSLHCLVVSILSSNCLHNINTFFPNLTAEFCYQHFLVFPISFFNVSTTMIEYRWYNCQSSTFSSVRTIFNVLSIEIKLLVSEIESFDISGMFSGHFSLSQKVPTQLRV